MMIPGIMAQRRGVVSAWAPSDMFGGELGAWYDVSDLSSMWQDSAGTVPAVVDSPVGKINDKSGNGNHLTQSTSANRPTLRSASGKYWLEFSGSHTLSGASNSAFIFMHSDSGPAHVCIGARFGTVTDPNAAYVPCGTNAGTQLNVGFFLAHDTRNGIRDRQLFFLNSKVGLVYLIDTPAASLEANVNAVVSTSLKDPSSNQGRIYVNGTSVVTATRSSSGTTANASFGLELGGAGNRQFMMTGRVYQMVLINRLPTTAEFNYLQSFVSGKM